jgi:hypothetical protein
MAASDGNGASRESAGAGLHRRVLDVRSRAASTVDSGSGGHGWRPRRSTGLGPQGRGELRAHRQVGLEAKHEREPWLSAMGALGPGPRRGGSLAGSWSPGRRGAKSSWSRRRVWRWAGWRSPKARTRCMPLGGTCCRNRRSISSAGQSVGMGGNGTPGRARRASARNRPRESLPRARTGATNRRFLLGSGRQVRPSGARPPAGTSMWTWGCHSSVRVQVWRTARAPHMPRREGEDKKSQFPTRETDPTMGSTWGRRGRARSVGSGPRCQRQLWKTRRRHSPRSGRARRGQRGRHAGAKIFPVHALEPSPTYLSAQARVDLASG